MPSSTLSLPALVLALTTVFAGTSAVAEPRAVVELFTSQGCAASPKADSLLSDLLKRGDVAVLTFPVDYWDYLGWKDTFGDPAHTARQRAYARARSDRKVYTPQIMVNGVVPAVGSDRTAVEKAIDETLAGAEVLQIPIEVEEAGGQIAVEIGDHPASPDAEVWLFALSRTKTVEIAGGENAHRKITYTNVVRRMTRLGAWAGKAVHFMVPHSEAVPKDADHYAVLVQRGSGSMPGAILGYSER
ncbi:DUF1223 domain-containing protein [Terrihabitans sp. B22-R8]|uniref:DUF1223 domain-containing protein n=1 Tax=Terrihabitans sp. B22-R8 TaxID=3425128 RepID=UPI00403C3F15